MSCIFMWVEMFFFRVETPTLKKSPTQIKIQPTTGPRIFFRVEGIFSGLKGFCPGLECFFRVEGLFFRVGCWKGLISDRHQIHYLPNIHHMHHMEQVPHLHRIHHIPHIRNPSVTYTIYNICATSTIDSIRTT